MNDNQAEWQRQRARMRRVLEANPLPAEEKACLMLDAEYMVARLKGESVSPPDHWSLEQISLFGQVFADPQARSAMMAWAIKGYQLLAAEADAMFGADEPTV